MVTVELVAVKNCNCKVSAHKRELRCKQHHENGTQEAALLGNGDESSPIYSVETARLLKKRLTKLGLPEIHNWSSGVNDIGSGPKSNEYSVPQKDPIQVHRPAIQGMQPESEHLRRSPLSITSHRTHPDDDSSMRRLPQPHLDTETPKSALLPPSDKLALGVDRPNIPEVAFVPNPLLNLKSLQHSKRPRLVLFEPPQIHDGLPKRDMLKVNFTGL